MGFTTTLELVRDRLDVDYSLTAPAVEDLLDTATWDLVALGDLVVDQQHGTSVLANDEGRGTPVLRMANMQDDGWDLSTVKHVELKASERAQLLLQPGDVLVNRTNGSRRLVGKSQVFRESSEWVFASYLMRLRIDRRRVLPEFLASFLNSSAGRLQIEHLSRKLLMCNINASELKRIEMPLPPIDIQQSMVDELMVSRLARDEAAGQAAAIEASLDMTVAEVVPGGATVGLPSRPFVVRLGAVRNRRLDPLGQSAADTVQESRVPLVPLDSVCSFNSRPRPAGYGPGDDVPYVGLPECSRTAVESVSSRRYEEVAARPVAGAGDILVARIEPSVFNKKFVLVGNLGEHEAVFLSTEFYVLRANESQLSQLYLYTMLFSEYVFEQFASRSTGSSGRRRVDIGILQQTLLPLPSRSDQDRIARSAIEGWMRSVSIVQGANELWTRARLEFERALFEEF